MAVTGTQRHRARLEDERADTAAVREPTGSDKATRNTQHATCDSAVSGVKSTPFCWQAAEHPPPHPAFRKAWLPGKPGWRGGRAGGRASNTFGTRYWPGS
ncbi:hypothetical protein DHEL01_v205404 [Diaporthe helianthi]|uniref:Uncharacterized protein n=1 Tax=Diaporthe helianthi TaxID=158607 RepID=A0A2P5I140_DIAHE|nr:hypothetical protein DHEL01_v205404 [Diaporthe helianthi]